MADDIDRAQALEEQERDASLEQQAAAAAIVEAPFDIEGVRVCSTCFEPIPRKRLRANTGAVRCVECQTRVERRHK